MPIISGTGGIDIVSRAGTALSVVGVKVACASVGVINRATISARVNAGDTLDAASVGRGGTGGDRDTEFEIEGEEDPEVVDRVVAIFDRGD